MGLKEKMADRWMENMDPGEKQKMMDSMMDNFFSKMSAEEKGKMMETMMEKFMAGLSPEEKQAMMGTMMPKMMGRGGEEEEGEGPWNMCQKMMASIGKSSELATFATPEVRGLFEEWAAQIEAEILQFVKESATVEADQVAARFKLSKDSANYFLTRLSQQGKISLKAEKAAEK